jgi:type III secretion protein Q
VVLGLFQYHLSAEVRTLLGYVRLLQTERPKGFGCRVSVTLGASRASGYVAERRELPGVVRGRPMARHRRADAGAVSTGHRRDPGAFALPMAQARSLRVGDVLVLEQAFSMPRATAISRLANSDCTVHRR